VIVGEIACFQQLSHAGKIPLMKSTLLVMIVVAVTCGSTSSQQSVQYFPPGAFYDYPALDAGVIRWYSKYLNVLGEPSLWATSKDSQLELYRFLWLRTWNQPVSIRVDRNSDGSATLTLKVATGSSGGDKPGKLNVVRTKTLTEEEFDAIADRFTAAGFWTMAPTVPSNGRDGARWVLEAAKSSRYRVVDRWSPEDGPIRGLALHILQLSGYAVAEDEVY
jgi:hypothetical protein